MLQYVVKRLLGALPTLLVIITLAFFLIRLAPGGPFDTERPMPPEIAANMERAYHLDRPLPVQYGYYLLNVLQGILARRLSTRITASAA
ncbi:hypothetical protein [Thiothrix subterranea]|uniref:hypothetical protein n=1 Tax=Thiothrix subterranea TaxID=2735563 RepID=UPI00280A5423|nr:hypothetical protein [Thiothrix subterranea]